MRSGVQTPNGPTLTASSVREESTALATTAAQSGSGAALSWAEDAKALVMHRTPVMAISDDLQRAASELDNPRGSVAEKHADAVDLYARLKTHGFTPIDRDFMTADPAGNFAWDARKLAAYFRSCAQEPDARK